MKTRGLLLFIFISLLFMRSKLQAPPEPQITGLTEQDINEQEIQGDEQTDGSIFDAIDEGILTNLDQESETPDIIYHSQVPDIQENPQPPMTSSEPTSSPEIQIDQEQHLEEENPCMQSGSQDQCFGNQATSKTHDQSHQQIQQQPIQDEDSSQDGNEKRTPLSFSPVETYMILEFLLSMQSRIHKAVDLSILAIAYINKELGVPQPYDAISFFCTLAIGFLILRKIPLCKCAKKKMYGQNNLNNLDYGPLVNATKQMQGEVEKLKKEVKAMREAQRDIIMECFSQVKLPVPQNVQVPVAIPQPVVVEKESSYHTEELKLNLLKIEESISGLKKDFQQQAEDQEEFQTVTMEAIKKIYQAMTSLNRPLAPPIPRPPSRQEEISTEDQGLFTPPQMPFEQSSSGNGGPPDLGTQVVGDSIADPSQKIEGAVQGAVQNERPTFDQQFSD